MKSVQMFKFWASVFIDKTELLAVTTTRRPATPSKTNTF